MFEKEIKFISDFSLNKIKKLGSFFTFEKLLNSNIHPAILQYINSELDYLIYQDRNKLLQKSVFDYSGSEISKYFNLIGNEIKKNKKVSYEDIKKLLIQAVSFNINFTVRPKWSLIKLVYEGSEVKSVEEIKMILNYLYYYDYIKNVFGQYLEKKKIFSLSQVEFEVILNKIDKAVLSSQSDDIIDNVLFSIGDFHNIGGINKTKISLNSFELFLKEKNLIDQLLKLRKSFPSDAKQKYDIEDIQTVLYSYGAVDIKLESFEEEIPEEQFEEDITEINDQEIEHEAVIVIDKEVELNNETVLVEDIEIEEIPEVNILEQVENDDSGDIEAKSNDDVVEGLNEEIEAEKVSLQEEESDNGEPENIDVQEEEFILDTEDDFKISEDDLVIDEEIEEEINNELKDFNLEESAEDILAKFDQELKSFEEEKSDEEIKVDSDEEEVNFDISEKEKLDELYDFEEENNTDSNQDEENLEEDDSLSDEIDNSLEANSQIEEKAELENEDFEITNENLEDQERTDLYDQAEEFENEEEKEEISTDEDDISEDDRSEGEDVYNKDKDLFSFLSEREIDKIVSGIFNEDREDFANTMEKISECNSYDQSTDILKGLFLTYRVNPYSKEAVMLTNAVSNYFDQA